jgi:hypothetical protein
LVRRPVAVGTLLNVELPTGDGRAPLKVVAGVVRAVGPEDGKWILGCHFVRELTNGEMQALDLFSRTDL